MTEKKRPEKKRFTSYLTVEALNELQELSERTRIPQSSLVEEAIVDLLSKYYGRFRDYQK